MRGTNTLAYCGVELFTVVKSLVVLSPRRINLDYKINEKLFW
jgi:hypothetical protein